MKRSNQKRMPKEIVNVRKFRELVLPGLPPPVNDEADHAVAGGKCERANRPRQACVKCPLSLAA